MSEVPEAPQAPEVSEAPEVPEVSEDPEFQVIRLQIPKYGKMANDNPYLWHVFSPCGSFVGKSISYG